MIKSREGENQPFISGAVSLPLSDNERHEVIFTGTDDVDVCLNCDLPIEQCRGAKGCYRKQKKKKDKLEHKKGGKKK